MGMGGTIIRDSRVNVCVLEDDATRFFAVFTRILNFPQLPNGSSWDRASLLLTSRQSFFTNVILVRELGFGLWVLHRNQSIDWDSESINQFQISTLNFSNYSISSKIILMCICVCVLLRVCASVCLCGCVCVRVILLCPIRSQNISST